MNPSPHESRAEGTPTPTSGGSDGSGLRASFVELLRKSELELPLLPATATRILAAHEDPSVDADEMADLVQRDPALAGHALHIANSGMYSPEEQIVSLQQAVARLGFQGLRNIVLTVTMRTKVFDVPGFETRIRNLWIHSAITAAWAREIARMRRTNVESAFLCGLLHDVGKPVVLQEFVSLAAAVPAPLSKGLSREWMTEFHEVVGRKVLKKWRLLDSVVDAVSHHHHPEQARNHKDEALTTCLADMLAHWTVDPNPERTELLRGHPVPVALGLYVEDVNNLLRRGEGVLRSAKGLM